MKLFFPCKLKYPSGFAINTVPYCPLLLIKFTLFISIVLTDNACKAAPIIEFPFWNVIFSIVNSTGEFIFNICVVSCPSSTTLSPRIVNFVTPFGIVLLEIEIVCVIEYRPVVPFSKYIVALSTTFDRASSIVVGLFLVPSPGVVTSGLQYIGRSSLSFTIFSEPVCETITVSSPFPDNERK